MRMRLEPTRLLGGQFLKCDRTVRGQRLPASPTPQVSSVDQNKLELYGTRISGLGESFTAEGSSHSLLPNQHIFVTVTACERRTHLPIPPGRQGDCPDRIPATARATPGAAESRRTSSGGRVGPAAGLQPHLQTWKRGSHLFYPVSSVTENNVSEILSEILC